MLISDFTHAVVNVGTGLDDMAKAKKQKTNKNQGS